MKIIIRNAPPDAPTQKWVGHHLICENCKSKFELEEGDTVGTQRRMDGKTETTFVFVACPVCREEVEKQIS